MLKMSHPGAQMIGSRVTFWPGFVDVLMSVLMILLLIYYLQTTIALLDPKAQSILQRQEHFVAKLEKALAQERAIHIVQDINCVSITFSDRVLFDLNDFKLHNKGESLLLHCAQVLKASQGADFEQIQVEGYTDNQPFRPGSGRDNWTLSTARALSVVKFLIERAGLKSEVFSASGYASNESVANNDTEEGRALNRRIELRIFFSNPHRILGRSGLQ
jgi:chemotaxis protein MotB